MNFEYTNVNFKFQANIVVGTTGFLFQIGRTGESTSSVLFSGYSGYLFDQSGNLFGGYEVGKQFSISGNYFFSDYPKIDNVLYDNQSTGRLSYFLNGDLICNNIYSTGIVDMVKFSGDKLSLLLITDTGSSQVLCDKNSNYLQSSDFCYLSF